MTLDLLLYGNLHSQLASALDLLPSENELVKQLKHYLIAGKVEGK